MKKASKSRMEVVPSEPVGSDDKRLFCRFPFSGVPVRFKDLKIGEKGSAVACDIGGGGVSIESARELKMRTPLELWFDLSDGFEPLHLLGKVVWSELIGTAWKIGVSFDRPRLMSLSRILKMDA